MAAAHRLGALMAVAAVLLVGCVDLIQEPVERPANGKSPLHGAFVGGVHPRWNDDGSLTVVFYVANLQARDLAEKLHGVRADIIITLKDAATFSAIEHQSSEVREEWRSHEVKQFEYRFSDVDPQGLYSITILAWPSNGHAAYLTECFDGGGWRPGAGKSCTFASWAHEAEILTHTEAEFHPLLRACCGWTPPPVDAYDAECRVTGLRADCSLTAWNWRNESAMVKGRLLVNETREDGSRRTLGEIVLPLTPKLAPDERRRVEVTVELDALPGVGRELSVASEVWHVDLPLSVHRQETSVRLLGN